MDEWKDEGLREIFLDDRCWDQRQSQYRRLQRVVNNGLKLFRSYE